MIMNLKHQDILTANTFNMKALYKGKEVDVVMIMTYKNEYLTHPVITQVKIEYKKGKTTYDAYVDSNEVKFIN